ncbi:MAG: hypothetical protein JXA37_04095 [Chloroflexia bacterium]|nr:hypothetical protein [Chloroflexia bacterium]
MSRKESIVYQRHGTSSLHEFLGDYIVYRGLRPADPRLPDLEELRQPLGLASGVLPRKAEPAYGQVVVAMLQQARSIERPGTTIRSLLYIGDTRLNDGGAFANLCAASGWQGWAFIGRDEPQQAPQFEVEQERLYLANRWSALPDFFFFALQQGLPLDETTAVVIDLDKTALGARGRNDRVIDRARLEGLRRTLAELLGPQFDQEMFRAAYNELNQPAYHAFTADNQDYLAYICLLVAGGIVQLEALLEDIHSGGLARVSDLAAQIQHCRAELAPAGLAAAHDQVWQALQSGDPTPFKAFRQNEYLSTAARFGDLPGAPLEQLLAQRIVITQEVRQAALRLRQWGALVLGLSDKPEEAVLPSEDLAEKGRQPLHRIETAAVGESNHRGNLQGETA